MAVQPDREVQAALVGRDAPGVVLKLVADRAAAPVGEVGRVRVPVAVEQAGRDAERVGHVAAVLLILVEAAEVLGPLQLGLRANSPTEFSLGGDFYSHL